MDSREYVFIFPLTSNSDIPADFGKELKTFSFDTGVFLPQDDTGWFTRAPKYPARLLLLENRSLHIIVHPTSAQPRITLRLDDLVQLETGTVLLRGWFRLTANSGVHEILYNTRASRPLEDFLHTLKTRWLALFPALALRAPQTYGDGLDIKFRNSVADELLRDEAIVAQYFDAPMRRERKLLFFKREYWHPGHAVALTSKNRLFWITDECGLRREMYASVSFSAPVASFQKCVFETDHECRQHITFRFAPDLTWRICVRSGNGQAELFCDVINRLLQYNPLPPALAINSEEKGG